MTPYEWHFPWLSCVSSGSESSSLSLKLWVIKANVRGHVCPYTDPSHQKSTWNFPLNHAKQPWIGYKMSMSQWNLNTFLWWLNIMVTITKVKAWLLTIRNQLYHYRAEGYRKAWCVSWWIEAVETSIYLFNKKLPEGSLALCRIISNTFKSNAAYCRDGAQKKQP